MYALRYFSALEFSLRKGILDIRTISSCHQLHHNIISLYNILISFNDNDILMSSCAPQHNILISFNDNNILMTSAAPQHNILISLNDNNILMSPCALQHSSFDSFRWKKVFFPFLKLFLLQFCSVQFNVFADPVQNVILCSLWSRFLKRTQYPWHIVAHIWCTRCLIQITFQDLLNNLEICLWPI